MMVWLRRQINSLAVRLLLPVAMMMIVIVAVLTAVVTRTYTDTILEQEAAKTQSAFSIMAGSINSLMDATRVLGMSVIQSDQVQSYARGNFEWSADRVVARWELMDTVNLLLAQNPDVYGLLFMREDGTVFGVLPYRNFFLESDMDRHFEEDILAQIREIRRGGIRWLGPVSGRELYRLGDDFDKAPEQVMLGVSYNKSIEYGTVYSIVVVDTAELNGLLGFLNDGRSSFFLAREDGVQLAAARPGTQILEQSWDVVRDGGNMGSASVETDGGERIHVSWQRIGSLGWYLMRELPMAEYDRTVNELQRFVLHAAMLVFAVALCMYLMWLRSFMHIFRALRAAIRRLGEGRLETRIERSFSISEFEEIRCEFNDMNHELESLVEATRAMERNQLELELRALQTQLSPHMIFNSITAIRWMASMLGAERVSDMLMELSEMLRPVFRDWAIEWTLGEEIQHLSHYANLLDLRYGNNFSMTMDVPEEMLELRLPRFTLQPLVENSCEHGGASGARLQVSVNAWMKDGRAVLCVRDDGAGIDPEIIEAIHAGLAAGEKTKRVGLYSVYNRLRICMGNSSCMEVSSPPEGGAEVTVSWDVNENIL